MLAASPENSEQNPLDCIFIGKLFCGLFERNKGIRGYPLRKFTFLQARTGY